MGLLLVAGGLVAEQAEHEPSAAAECDLAAVLIAPYQQTWSQLASHLLPSIGYWLWGCMGW